MTVLYHKVSLNSILTCYILVILVNLLLKHFTRISFHSVPLLVWFLSPFLLGSLWRNLVLLVEDIWLFLPLDVPHVFELCYQEFRVNRGVSLCYTPAQVKASKPKFVSGFPSAGLDDTWVIALGSLRGMPVSVSESHLPIFLLWFYCPMLTVSWQEFLSNGTQTSIPL